MFPALSRHIPRAQCRKNSGERWEMESAIASPSARPRKIVEEFALLKTLINKWKARREKKLDVPVNTADTRPKEFSSSLIIVVYNLNERTAATTERCIESIKSFTNDYELIIIDNASSFGTDVLRKEADVYVRNRKNLGYAPGANQGLKLACGEYLAVLNNDIVFQTEWLTPLVDALKKNPLIAVIRPGEHRERGEGVVLDYKDYHGFCYVIPRKIYTEFKDDRNNLLSEDFKFGYFEDLHLWWRILSRGYAMAKHFGVRVSHKGGYTIHQMPNLSEITRENERTFVAKTGLSNWREHFYR
jgi:GT2 family glycosyltransferase